MKLAMFVPGGVDRSGVDRVVPALLWQIERMARRHEVHVFALSQEIEPGHWSLLGAHVHNIGTTHGRSRRFVSWFRAEHRRVPFDVIHAFWAGPLLYPVIATVWHIPLIVHLAGGEMLSLGDIRYGGCCSWRGRALLRATFGAARVVSVASRQMQQLARAHDRDTELVPLGVALDSWPIAAPRERDASKPARLLHIGDLRPVKNQTLLLRAAAVLRNNGVCFELDIAGHDTLNGEMQALAKKLDLVQNVRWHGVLRREPLRSLVEAADLLLVTSRHDAGPLVVLEAAIAGVPTIGTAVGHVADWVPEAAVSVAGDSEFLFAAAIMRLLADEPRRLAIAREAQCRALMIDADYTAARFDSIYDDVIAPRGFIATASVRTVA